MSRAVHEAELVLRAQNLPPIGTGVQVSIEDESEGHLELMGDVIDTRPGEVRVWLVGLESRNAARWYPQEDVKPF